MTVKEFFSKGLTSLGNLKLDGLSAFSGKLKEAWSQLPKIARWVGLAVVCCVCLFITLRVAEVVFFLGLYRSWFSSFHGAGISDGPSGLLAFLCSLATFAAVPSLAGLVFWRRSLKRYLTVGGVALALALVSYFISQPKDGQYFNPITGSAMFKYSQDGGGNIALFPVGYSFDPVSGRKLEMVNPQIIEVYLKQLALRPKPVVKSLSDLDTLPVDDEYREVRFKVDPEWFEKDGCNLRFAGIRIEDQKDARKMYILVHVLGKELSWSSPRGCELLPEHESDLVLTDNVGRSVPQFTTTFEVNAAHKNEAGQIYSKFRALRENEPYAYILTVEGLSPKARVFNVSYRGNYLRLEILGSAPQYGHPQ